MLIKILTLCLLIAAFLSSSSAQRKINENAPVPCSASETSYGLSCTKQKLTLTGSAKFTVKVYTKLKPGARRGVWDRTFVVVHANEEKGLDAAKKVISETSGRLVEIVSRDPADPAKSIRRLYFGEKSENCVDPNRIYTRTGIRKTLADASSRCKTISDPPQRLINDIDAFAKSFLRIVTNNGRSRLIIGVHNNDDSLSPENWGVYANGDIGGDFKSAVGIFKANDHQHNTAFDTGSHNFVMATNGRLFGKLLDNHITSLILQEGSDFLTSPAGSDSKKIKDDLDDGSMSIYFGSGVFGEYDYMIIEAGGKRNEDGPAKIWQLETLKKLATIKF